MSDLEAILAMTVADVDFDLIDEFVNNQSLPISQREKALKKGWFIASSREAMARSSRLVES